MLVKARRIEKGSKLKEPFKWTQSFSKTSFRCPVKCDACCRRSIGPGLTEKDYQRISREASDSHVAEKRDHPLFPYQLKSREGACLFLNNQGQCSIYSIRPILCRLYPLQLHFQWDGKLLWCLEHCPGVGVEKGIALEGAYLESLLLELLEKEGETFLGNLREYVLKTKKYLPILFKTTSGGVYCDWITKTKMKKIVWEMFQAKALNFLTPRGRLECVLHELLPSFEAILKNKVEELPGEKKYYLDPLNLSDGFKEYKEMFHELALKSAARERIHLENLGKKGSIAYGAEWGGTVRCSQQSSIIVRGFDGRKIEINAGKLMRILDISREASQVEERYLNELQRREGRFGVISTDLTIHSEVALMFLAADALELKANAFAIEKGKDAIGIGEIKEAVWLVERHLSGMLELVQSSETLKAIG
jgi:Fe-S-cluster containining protein